MSGVQTSTAGVSTGFPIGVVAASEGVLYTGPSTLARSDIPPDFDRALPLTDTFVRATVVSIGRAHLNTDSGDLVDAPQPVGYFPFTPVTFAIEEIVVQRPLTTLGDDITAGEEITIDLPGGSVTASMTGAMAATMFLVDEGAVDPSNSESEPPVGAADPVEIAITFDGGLSLAVGDEVVLGLSNVRVEWVSPDGRSIGQALLSLADGPSSVVILSGDVVRAAAHATLIGMPTTVADLRARIAWLRTSAEPVFEPDTSF